MRAWLPYCGCIPSRPRNGKKRAPRCVFVPCVYMYAQTHIHTGAYLACAAGLWLGRLGCMLRPEEVAGRAAPSCVFVITSACGTDAGSACAWARPAAVPGRLMRLVGSSGMELRRCARCWVEGRRGAWSGEAMRVRAPAPLPPIALSRPPLFGGASRAAARAGSGRAAPAPALSGLLRLPGVEGLASGLCPRLPKGVPPCADGLEGSAGLPLPPHLQQHQYHLTQLWRHCLGLQALLFFRGARNSAFPLEL